MSTRNRRSVRKYLILFAIILAIAWLAPSFFSAERYRRRLETGLEQVLKRPVTFGAVSFRLIPYPGFSIRNVVIREDPAFGSEPFARVDRIDCELRWRSFWHSRFSFSRLYLENPTLNAVRDARGQWNVESLLVKGGLTSFKGGDRVSRPADPVDLAADGARINFKVGEDKKAFAITDLRARLTIDPPHGLVRFNLTGKPVRMDLSLPTPGEVNLRGVWTPGPGFQGPLEADITLNKSMVYDWIPLVSGLNPGIYGVADVTVRIKGSLRRIIFEGDGSVGQLHRWDLQPPASSAPLNFQIRGSFDRETKQVMMQKLDLAFVESHVLVSGAISQVLGLTNLDLAVELQPVRFEDVMALGCRFSSDLSQIDGSGRFEGKVWIGGTSDFRTYKGLLTGHDLHFRMPQGRALVEDALLRIDDLGVHLSPVKLHLAPRLVLVAQGEIERAPLATGSRAPVRRLSRSHPGVHSASEGQSRPLFPGSQGMPGAGPRYHLSLSANAWPLADLVDLAYQNGVTRLRGVEAQKGVCAGSLLLTGGAWPPSIPRIAGRIELVDGEINLAGLSMPLTISHAVVNIDGQRIVADPVSAAIGQGVFTGRLEHDGDHSQVWNFAVGTDQLMVDQAAPWFEVLGYRAPESLLEQLPGLSSFATRRAAASSLFGALNARGQFAAAELDYQSLVLKGFTARVDISGRVVKVTDAGFRAAGGWGRGSLVTDLSAQPPRLTGRVTLQEANLRLLTHKLEGPLRDTRGTLSLAASFASKGLSRVEIAANLTAQGKVAFKSVSMGDFDLLGALVKDSQNGTLEPARHGGTIRQAEATVEVRDRRLTADFATLDISGAEVALRSTFGFDRRLDLEVRADLTHMARRWMSAVSSPGGISAPENGIRRLDVHLTGDLASLKRVSEVQAERSPASK